MKARIFIGPEASGKTWLADKIADLVGIEKTANICAANQIMNSVYVFSKVPDDALLIIVDDFPISFNFDKFLPTEDENKNEDNLTFSIRKEKKGSLVKIIQVPWLIFTANQLPLKWHKYDSSFRSHFEIITFPLSEPDKLNIINSYK